MPEPHQPPTGTVTFLFTDIEGSTKRWEASPVAMQAAFARQEAMVRHAIEANGGYAYKMIGDAFQAAFPTAPQALQAAINAQRALRSETWPEEGGEVRVRMALHTGTTEERGDDYVGPALNRVARLLSAGHGGQVLLSTVMQELVRDYLPPGVTLLDLGEHRLKDLIRPEHIFQLVAADLPSQFPPLKTLDNRPNNLPLQATPLIGRERELAEVGKLLAHEEVRLLTLTGPGGTGKTRLGLQVASELLDDFPDGVWFVALASLTDAGLVAPTIAQTLGVREAPGKPIIDTLMDYLADMRLLLVLDNFEQVMDALGMVTALVKAAPHVKILVTSREKLNIYGEHEYTVPPLSLPNIKPLPPLQKLTHYEAVQLFIERARAAKADFEVNNDNAPAVAEICVRLDGLPLAIELAAARVKMLPPQALLARLSSRLKLLTGGGRDLSSRQQTLRGTIDWSYHLLSGEEKRFFSEMAVFQGGRTLGALEEVCNFDGNLGLDVLDGVQSLLDKSLLQQREGHDGEPHFWMLETIHEYAREKLEESGQAAMLRRSHALYFMRLAEEAEPHLTGKKQREWLDRLEEEYDNIRAALYWARESKSERGTMGTRRKRETEEKMVEAEDKDAEALQAVEIGLRIGGAIGRFWNVRGYYSEGWEQLSGLLGVDRMLEVENAVEVQEAEEAEEAEEAQVRANRVGPDADGQQTHGAYTYTIGNVANTDYKANRAKALGWAGVMAWEQGDYPPARSLHEESLAIVRELGDKQGIAVSLNNLGNVVFEQGDYSSARSLYEESLSIRRELGDKWGMAVSLNSLGTLAQLHEDYASARSLFEESLAIARELGDKWGMAVPTYNLGAVAQHQGDYASARSLYEESLAIARDLGDKPGIVYSLAGLGGVEVGSADDASRVGTTGSGGVGETEAMRATGGLTKGARLLGAVEAMLERIGTVMWSEDRRPYERAVAQARIQLAEKEFEKAWEEGRAMSIQEAIEYALEASFSSQT